MVVTNLVSGSPSWVILGIISSSPVINRMYAMGIFLIVVDGVTTVITIVMPQAILALRLIVIRDLTAPDPLLISQHPL
jgi:hypothetical protein